jgi:WD40 repeat protein
VWRLPGGTLERTLPGVEDPGTPFAFSPDGRYLAQGLTLRDVATGAAVRTFAATGQDVRALAFSPSGKTLATAGPPPAEGAGPDAAPDGEWMVTVWNAETGEVEGWFAAGVGEVTDLAFDRAGRRLAVAGRAGTVVVRALAGDEPSLTLRGHTGAVESVAFSPDGERLVTASDDGTVKLWDARVGQELLTLRGHRSAVFSRDGRRLAAVGEGETVQVWDGTPAE